MEYLRLRLTCEMNKNLINNKNELANHRSQEVIALYVSSTVGSRLNFSLISYHSLSLIGQIEKISDYICC